MTSHPGRNSVHRDRRGGIALITAASLLPILVLGGMAIDFGFYIQASARLNLAADAAAMYAVRTAMTGFTSGNSAAAIAAGQTAGQQWFAAQAGQISTAVVPSYNVNVTLTYTQNPGGFSAIVQYTGTVKSQLGGILGYTSYSVKGSASTVISEAYVEIVMLLDDSGSMSIGATDADMLALEKATPCSTQAATSGQAMNNYPWTYTGNYGYQGGNTAPPTSTTNGACYASYTGDPSLCFYVPKAIASLVNASGACKNGGGGWGSFGANTPQSPCAMACHSSASSNDYYGLARSLGLTLRLDVVEQAAAGVIQTLQAQAQSANQFLVGVYEFSSSLRQVYPTAGSGEAGTDLATALQKVQALTPVVVSVNGSDTDFTKSADSLAAIVTNAGDGTSQSTPRKNLFIITDGLQDSASNGNGPMTSTSNEQTCQQFKNMGFTVYVLYTPYLPVANNWYLTYEKQYVEPATVGGTSAIVAALQACATSSSTFIQASDATAINAAMQEMLESAISTAGRITN